LTITRFRQQAVKNGVLRRDGMALPRRFSGGLNHYDVKPQMSGSI
jgi:hypothetical protein